MNILLIFSFLFSFTNYSDFDNRNFVKDEVLAKSLESQFVKDIPNGETYELFSSYLENHMTDITHISGHYSSKSNIFYYVVYGYMDGIETIEMFEVDKHMFDNNKYYTADSEFSSASICRRGIDDIQNEIFCEGPCQVRTDRCFGICCTPEECGGPSEHQTGDPCTVDIPPCRCRGGDLICP